MMDTSASIIAYVIAWAVGLSIAFFLVGAFKRMREEKRIDELRRRYRETEDDGNQHQE